MTKQDDMQADIAENRQGLAVHEAVCAERYQGILDKFETGDHRMTRIETKSVRIERILYFVVFLLFIGLLGGKDMALKLFEIFPK